MARSGGPNALWRGPVKSNSVGPEMTPCKRVRTGQFQDARQSYAAGGVGLVLCRTWCCGTVLYSLMKDNLKTLIVGSGTSNKIMATLPSASLHWLALEPTITMVSRIE
ncbi:unnamed protein product [Mortierella alpina]